MNDADRLLIEQLKVVVAHCVETGLQSGAVAVENAIGELARLRASSRSLPCGHPSGCCILDGATKSQYCGWCAAVAKPDVLAAENRILVGAVIDLRKALVRFDAHEALARLDHALSQPNTAREVERVKRLEAVVEAARELLQEERHAGVWAATSLYGMVESSLAALDKLAKVA